MSDFVIIGGGIVGMTIALELKSRFQSSKISIIEKEPTVGRHASGRNSGVIHSGIYNQPGSLKSDMCLKGGKLLIDWAKENGVTVQQVGKCIIPADEADLAVLEKLHLRASQVGINALLIRNDDLTKIEPYAFSCVNKSLYLPDVHIIDSIGLVNRLKEELVARGVEFIFFRKAQVRCGKLFVNGRRMDYGQLFNAAGMYSDTIAHGFGVAKDYNIVPFKGTYYRLNETSRIKVFGLIYPVPDLEMPFLGIHFTKMTNGNVYIGPNALCCFGKENYHGMQGINLEEAGQVLRCVMQMYLRKPKMRRYIHSEIFKLSKQHFVRYAKLLLPSIKHTDFERSTKCGIRAQLMNNKTNELVDDFMVVTSEKEVHVLNAVSPALTCSMAFAKYIVDQYVPYHC